MIDSQTSVSCAQRRTRCVPLRPRTMAMPVPHAPAPMTAISLIRASIAECGSSVPAEQATNVLRGA